MFAQKGFRFAPHQVVIHGQVPNLPAKIAEKRHRTRKERIDIIARNGVIARMKVRIARFQLANLDGSPPETVDGARQFLTVDFAVIVKMDHLAPSVHARVGPAGSDQIDRSAKSRPKGFFQCGLDCYKPCLPVFVLLLPTEIGAAQIFAAETIAHTIPQFRA